VLAGNKSFESCGNVPNEMLLNQVQGNEIQVLTACDVGSWAELAFMYSYYRTITMKSHLKQE